MRRALISMVAVAWLLAAFAYDQVVPVENEIHCYHTDMTVVVTDHPWVTDNTVVRRTQDAIDDLCDQAIAGEPVGEIRTSSIKSATKLIRNVPEVTFDSGKWVAE